jgi:hypothetical protein
MKTSIIRTDITNISDHMHIAYVVEVLHPDETTYYMSFREIFKIVYSRTDTTWAYSKIQLFSNLPCIITSSIISKTLLQSISYWAFSDKQDALAFILYLPSKYISRHATMWPSNVKFTLHDFQEMENGSASLV